MVQEFQTQQQISYEVAIKLRDLEQGQKLMKDRVLLIGKNLIEFEEKSSAEITEIKKEVQEMKTDVKRIKSIIESLSEEVSKSARKEELAILSRQYKMFEPLNYARIEDVEEIIDEKLGKGKKNSQKKKLENSDSKHAFWAGKV